MIAAELLGAVVADGWWMHDETGSGGWMGAMAIWMVIVWAAILLGAVWLVRGGWDRRPSRGDTALEILDRRLAEGAISVDEYRERKAVLARERVRHVHQHPDAATKQGVEP